jgi:hypothetical protein
LLLSRLPLLSRAEEALLALEQQLPVQQLLALLPLQLWSRACWAE